MGQVRRNQPDVLGAQARRFPVDDDGQRLRIQRPDAGGPGEALDEPAREQHDRPDEAVPTGRVAHQVGNPSRLRHDLLDRIAVAPVAGHGECLAVVADPAHPPRRPGPGPGLDEEEALGAHQEMVHVEVGAGDVVEHPVPPVSQLIESVGDLPLTVEAQLEPLDRGSGSPHLDARPADRGERDGRQELRTRHRAQPSDPFPDGDQGEQCRRHHRLVGIALDDRSDRLVQ